MLLRFISSSCTSITIVAAWTVVHAQTLPPQPRYVPTVDQILSLKRAGSPEVSPDGRYIAYTIRETNWEENSYDTQIWLADATSGATHQLTV